MIILLSFLILLYLHIKILAYSIFDYIKSIFNIQSIRHIQLIFTCISMNTFNENSMKIDH